MRNAKTLSLVTVLMLSVLSAGEKTASATPYNNATPAFVNQLNATRSPTDVWGNSSWFNLTGVSSLGTCGVWNGLVAFKIKDADKFVQSTVTSALLSGKKLTVYVDDGAANKEGTFCVVQSVIIQ